MIRQTPDGVVVAVRVVPRSAASAVTGFRGEAVLVRLHAPPVEGAANAELVRVLAGALGVPPRAVSIVSGGRSRDKHVAVTGIDVATAARKLNLSRGD